MFYAMANQVLDTDIHIPFFVRGPGVAKDGLVDVVTTHTDVSSTLLEIAGVSKQLDGVAIPLKESQDSESRHEHATIEYWGAVRGDDKSLDSIY
jgi:arylsulfatase A-like enzyme